MNTQNKEISKEQNHKRHCDMKEFGFCYDFGKDCLNYEEYYKENNQSKKVCKKCITDFNKDQCDCECHLKGSKTISKEKCQYCESEDCVCHFTPPVEKEMIMEVCQVCENHICKCEIKEFDQSNTMENFENLCESLAGKWETRYDACESIMKTFLSQATQEARKSVIEEIKGKIENEMPMAWFPNGALHLKKRFLEEVINILTTLEGK